MEDIHKRPGEETAGDVSVKRLRFPVNDEDTDYFVGDNIVGYFSTNENETVDDLMNLLEPEKDGELKTAGTVNKVRFIENPYSSQLSSSAYITINHNEESCGSSLSVCDSSMMASIYTSSLSITGNQALDDREALEKWAPSFVVGEGSACTSNDETKREGGLVSRDGILDGCDGCDWDYEVLARFLGVGVEEEEHFSDQHC
ncbi:Protein SON like [Quillaja saponaria]|uniref:Protein SON like n=1 Tax=Quillaja saponaria TaxID=32244 RepID=A0AAD7PHK5_QUISA|nr:Protein SON like [Quillaja saponaria]